MALMSALSKVVASVEFALIARVASVAAVAIGFFATIAAALAGLVLNDIRGDLKAVVMLAQRLDIRAEVHEARLGNIDRRLDKIEIVAFPLNGLPPIINRGNPAAAIQR